MNLRWRLVPHNQAIFDLVDLYESDEITRIFGVASTQISAQVFFNNVPQPWTMVEGAGVSDAQILAGYIYWVEAQPGSGVYSIRWRPNAIGFWRLCFTYTPVPQILTLDYDVAVFNPSDRGLKVSFIE